MPLGACPQILDYSAHESRSSSVDEATHRAVIFTALLLLLRRTSQLLSWIAAGVSSWTWSDMLFCYFSAMVALIVVLMLTVFVRHRLSSLTLRLLWTGLFLVTCWAEVWPARIALKTPLGIYVYSGDIAWMLWMLLIPLLLNASPTAALSRLMVFNVVSCLLLFSISTWNICERLSVLADIPGQLREQISERGVIEILLLQSDGWQFLALIPIALLSFPVFSQKSRVLLAVSTACVFLAQPAIARSRTFTSFGHAVVDPLGYVTNVSRELSAIASSAAGVCLFCWIVIANEFGIA